MVVIGIDFGSDSCVVSLWKNNRVETMLNDYFERKTPSYVAFSENKRIIGVAALNQHASNVTNTIFGFRNEIGSNSDTDTATSNVFGLLDIIEDGNGSLSYKVKYQNSIYECRPVTAASMLLSKLEADARNFSKMSSTGCVIAVPSYFTERQQKDLLLAAGIAGLNCFYLIKETTSVAVNYAFNKKFPTPINVIFIDFGRSSIQVSACLFSGRVIKMIAEVSELIGGWGIDKMLARYFIESHRISAGENKSFCVGLLSEVEKLKKKVGLVANALPLCIEHLLDIENRPTLQRSEMEEICQPIFDIVEGLLRQILTVSKLCPGDIHSIEIVGGSTRIPRVRELIEMVFGQQPKMTMNQDEAVSKGCLLSWVNMIRRLDKFEIIDIPTPRQSYEKNGFMRIKEVHSNYIASEKDDCLFVTLKDCGMLKQGELDLIKADEKEKQRFEVRNKLDELLNAVEDDASFMQLVGPGCFDEIKYWHQGTTEEYQKKIVEITQLFEKSKSKHQTDSKLDDQNSTPPPLKEAIIETTLKEISAEVNLVDNPTFEEPRDEVMEFETIPEDSFSSNIDHPAIKEVIYEEPQLEAPIPITLPDFKRKALHAPSELASCNYNTVYLPKIQQERGFTNIQKLKKENSGYSAPAKVVSHQHNGILDGELVEKWIGESWQYVQGEIGDLRQRIGKAIEIIQRIQRSQVVFINFDIFKTIIEQQIRESLNTNTHIERCKAYDKLLKLLQVALHFLSSFYAHEVKKVSARSTAV